MADLYGGTCHLCGHALCHHHGAIFARKPCDDCAACEYDAFTAFIRTHVTEDMFSPEVREAVVALRQGRGHPLIDRMIDELHAEERSSGHG